MLLKETSLRLQFNHPGNGTDTSARDKFCTVAGAPPACQHNELRPQLPPSRLAIHEPAIFCDTLGRICLSNPNYVSSASKWEAGTVMTSTFMTDGGAHGYSSHAWIDNL